MVLNRQALESKLLQQLLAHPELDFDIWSDERLLQSVKETLKHQPNEELWIFAYGSLIWNPLFDYCDRTPVTLEDWHRQFCLLAPVGRGTIDNPGLVLGLEAQIGSHCQGIAYRLPIDDSLESELLLLWRREMVVGSYIPTWIAGKNGDRDFKVLAFVVDSQHSAYVNWSTVSIVETLATASGSLGSSAEYLDNTVKGLLAAGIEDKTLVELDRLVKHRQQQIRLD
ncbi:MAG: gamma-glutamylcyclotransferase [Cyanobacteria bacterium P01_G01_bin.19]